jgi:hypothetical protein
MKKQDKNWEKIFAKHIPHVGHASKLY